jgi:hypothetical protein
MSSPTPAPLLTVRAAVVLLIAVVVGIVAGALGYLAHHDVPLAILVACAAAGGALALFQGLLGR